MPVKSLSLLRHHAPPYSACSTTVTFLLRRFTHTVVAARNRHNHTQPNKNNLLKVARESTKQLSSLTSLPPPQQLNLAQNQAIGMVASAQANFMRVIVNPEPSTTFHIPEGSSTPIELLCVVRAVLKKIKRRVLVGDRVLVGSIDWIDGRGMIENVYSRDSEILDPPIANADHILVVFSMDQPKIEPFNLTRFLVEAESIGIPVSLALNKCELVAEEELIAWKSRLRKWGYLPIYCSAETGRGLDSLAFTLRDRTTVIVGPSGVGKSSLINVLRKTNHSPSSMEESSLFDPIRGSKWYEEQRVGEVSARSGRGKHTTRNVSLLPLAGGGYLADTPGFNQPSLLKVTKHSLAQAFPEIQKMVEESEAKKCGFNNCLHIGEPGCVVKGDWERYPYYFQLLDEIKIREEFQLRTLGTKREGDVRKKIGEMGVVEGEPRLEAKKHRRPSRKKVKQSILDELDEDDDEYMEDSPPIITHGMEEEENQL